MTTDPYLAAVALAPALGWAAHSLWMVRRLHAARLDPLTGLPTRHAFTVRARRGLRRRELSVLLLDLDDFKLVNDTFGHASGDRLLAAVAEQLHRWCAAHGGFAARIGGDEFAAVAEMGAQDTADLAHVLLNTTVDVGHAHLTPVFSLGVCLPEDYPGACLAERLHAADQAMYAAKSLGSRWHIAGEHPTHRTAAGRRAGRHGTHAALSR
ncbi:GGDEF domain-containing protein [Streptomyces sp. NPDC001941]|uniref:GGDEF domain-containing protein n=1 Tax=Streptomyces sp. NPDC001941 TaxID=3154659 RepID=UPI00333027CD